jgi:hypothetical protein
MRRDAVVCTTLLRALLALMIILRGGGHIIAGMAGPNVTGQWEGTWIHRVASGQVTLQLVQEGTKVIGKQHVRGAMPVFGGEQRPMTLGEEIRDGVLEGSTLIYHVSAPNSPSGQINVTLTTSDEEMTGTACAYTCATVKLKKSKL